MATAEMVPVGEVLARGQLVSQGSGTLAIAMMADEEFEQRLATLRKGQDRIRRIKRDLMTDGVHYGTIPGTDKPTLLKPGAEVLCSIYGLRPDFVSHIEYGNGHTEPAIRVSMRCELHAGDLAGPVVAVGLGAANSWERKHRYRRGERSCPECGTVGSVIKGKADFGGGWLCWAKKGGCGAKWPAGTAEIEQQAVGDVENPDQHDLENTLLKMAKKRAFLDGALIGTASSDLFTQDLDEQQPEPAPAPPKAPAPERRVQPEEPTEITGDADYPRDEDAYDRHEVDPPAPAGSRAAGPKPACPKCGNAQRVGPSRYPKKGKEWYCGACAAGFGARS